MPPEHHPQQVAGANYHYDNQENERMGVGERRNKLGNRVVGHHFRQHIALSAPPKGRRIVGQLHPHGVDAVGRNNTDVGHNKVLALLHAESIGLHAVQRLFGKLADKRQTVGLDDKVIVVGVVMG